jgi:hypothetical protein
MCTWSDDNEKKGWEKKKTERFIKLRKSKKIKTTKSRKKKLINWLENQKIIGSVLILRVNPLNWNGLTKIKPYYIKQTVIKTSFFSTQTQTLTPRSFKVAPSLDVLHAVALNH